MPANHLDYVLNGAANQAISAATRERVLAAVKELGYVSNRLARALKEGGSRIVLLDLYGLPTGESLNRFMTGLDTELSRHGYVLLVHHGHTSSLPITDVAISVAAHSVNSARHLDQTSTQALQQAHINVAQSWYTNESTLPSPVHKQLEYLASKGHRNIVFAVPCDATLEEIANSRYEEALVAARTLGLPEPRRLVVDADKLGELSGILRGLRLAGNPTTAIAAYNDDTALGALSAMQLAGLTAPNDLR